ncbi:hypothetical protein [uncultured Paraglaciecola sp.]|uniref:hypothetical protein n=1 Tax=uncultured Paraglaciecola sp. TaxID=1765024 RepID=UPI00261A1F65|nr:hypothetical protein [uncultured Paraglaciecola sp.]
MTTNAPKPLFIDDLTETNNSFAVSGGYSGYYARVQIRTEHTGSKTLTVTNPATSVTLDTVTDGTTASLFYIIQNLTEDQYNVITIDSGTFTGRALVEYFRLTSER